MLAATPPEIGAHMMRVDMMLTVFCLRRLSMPSRAMSK